MKGRARRAQGHEQAAGAGQQQRALEGAGGVHGHVAVAAEAGEGLVVAAPGAEALALGAQGPRLSQAWRGPRAEGVGEGLPTRANLPRPMLASRPKPVWPMWVSAARRLGEGQARFVEGGYRSNCMPGANHSWAWL
jgi:hypothetical protein